MERDLSMSQEQPDGDGEVAMPEDLPAGLVRLARQIARDCVTPGTYAITLEVPHASGMPRTAEISRLERLRILEIRPV